MKLLKPSSGPSFAIFGRVRHVNKNLCECLPVSRREQSPKRLHGNGSSPEPSPCCDGNWPSASLSLVCKSPAGGDKARNVLHPHILARSRDIGSCRWSFRSPRGFPGGDFRERHEPSVSLVNAASLKHGHGKLPHDVVRSLPAPEAMPQSLHSKSGMVVGQVTGSTQLAHSAKGFLT